MRILVIQNSHTAPAGLVGEELERAGAGLVTVAADEGEPIPEMGDFAGLVVLGGPQDAWDDGHGPHFGAVMERIRSFTAAERPVMGICLGAQLAARAYGARVYRHTAPELGVHPVTLTGGAAEDPLLAGLGPEVQVAQWHFDTFDYPDGAVHLAESPLCGRQAFRLGRATFGFQFHPEATAEILRGWATKPDHGHAPPPVALDRLEQAMADHLPAAEDFARTVTRRWLELA
ncbi:GMP synthase [Azospirillum thermophilum]|uniref:GMP synthase n=2 Tax=Azospirillum thermophilum TaxID=2202148 RepID=A0A2S2CN41_9PROT|nr:GMP synthase [Azospirillum thermophilum]